MPGLYCVSMSLVLCRFLLVLMLIIFSSSISAKDGDDYSLTSLIYKAFNYHSSIKSQDALLYSVKKTVETAKWQYFPALSVSASQVEASERDTSYVADDKIISLGIDQVLWAGGGIDAGLEKARAQLNIRRFNTLITKRDLALNVIRYYGIWYGSYLKLKVFASSKKEHESLKKTITNRIQQGLSSKSDLSFVQARLSQVGLDLVIATTNHKNALLKLEELIGEPLDTELLIKHTADDYIINNDKEVALNQTLKIDPSLKILLEQAKEAHSNYKEVKSNLYPTLKLRFEKQWGSYTNADADNEDRFFLELSSNFGAGLSLLSRIESARLTEHSILLDLETQKNTTIQKFESDWTSYQSLSEQKKLLKAALLSVKKIQQSWYRQYLNGRKQWIDVMNSIREVNQLESKMSDVIVESLLTSWRLAISIKGVGAI